MRLEAKGKGRTKVEEVRGRNGKEGGVLTIEIIPTSLTRTRKPMRGNPPASPVTGTTVALGARFQQ